MRLVLEYGLKLPTTVVTIVNDVKSTAEWSSKTVRKVTSFLYEDSLEDSPYSRTILLYPCLLYTSDAADE